MFKPCIAIFFCILSSCATKFYIVRHAEKEVQTADMSSDVELSDKGEERAEALKKALRNKNIRHIFSTNYIRTIATAQPLSEAIGVSTLHYDPRDTAFISMIKSLHANALIVGHSNTVDDIVNGLTGAGLTDLTDTQYGDLFIVTRKGDKYILRQSRFGK